MFRIRLCDKETVMAKKQLNIFWFRRDLRLHDNNGLFKALESGRPVLLLFIFDRNILDELDSDDARVTFIHNSLKRLQTKLVEFGSDIEVHYGHPIDVWQHLIGKYEVDQVFTNHDYEPYATNRDEEVSTLLQSKGIGWNTFKDHVIFEKQEILSNAGKVYTVFTPYKRKWLPLFEQEYLQKIPRGSASFYPSEEKLNQAFKRSPKPIIELQSMGFVLSELPIPSSEVAQKVIRQYGERRNFPAIENGTSKLGIHFRFGTISIREKALKAAQLSEVYLSELIWRDFYAQILANFPSVVSEAFKPKYDKIAWRDNEEELDKWKSGNTGYPIVDAGMRELNATGYMHNRVRMIVASFLTKHLLMDWRHGEAYFAKKLLDFDLASNNGGWQWASGSGTDAAPYFRIFNPTSQMDKFDKDRTYIKKWVPEYGTDDYPQPMVDHKYARERCLSAYREVLQTT